MANFVAKVRNFLAESYDELVHKVTWLKYSTLQNQTILVLVASLIFALIIGFVIDKGLEEGLKMWYKSTK
ncbi:MULTISPECIES: preprotein translocase subunit SecE [Raineya]|jgi:preprotein translocase subunit SecE|uniref:Preprotein translocase, SecE subunit n=1 Tax=Raineya orbicola TaxID=2016530 RepID=A0A2N3IHQ0_9BACT|nr:preprotein translocase subunit SecE [Raineya orbicola]PKQ69852.1 Preprotein translocase, SecE subunit [Raineya orbicola]